MLTRFHLNGHLTGFHQQTQKLRTTSQDSIIPRGGTLGISGWGYAAGTLEPLTYTRASSAEFCYPILE